MYVVCIFQSVHTYVHWLFIKIAKRFPCTFFEFISLVEIHGSSLTDLVLPSLFLSAHMEQSWLSWSWNRRILLSFWVPSLAGTPLPLVHPPRTRTTLSIHLVIRSTLIQWVDTMCWCIIITLQTLMQEVRVGRPTEAVLIGLDTISVVRDIAYTGSCGKLSIILYHKPSSG
jgi:hypothetical protein